MSTVNVNGKNYEVPNGCSVSVINGKIYFDGKLADDLKNCKDKKIEIIIVGDCGEVKVDAGNVTVKGSVKGNVNVDAGNISVEGDIRGNVTADCGNISANYIAGNVSTDCGNTYYGNHNNMEIIDRKWQRTFEPAQNTIFRRLPIWI